eukprot:1318903-Rhodomonas_salina.1
MRTVLPEAMLLCLAYGMPSTDVGDATTRVIGTDVGHAATRVISLLPKQIGEYMEAVSDILGVALQDSNPSVRKEACQVLQHTLSACTHVIGMQTHTLS